MRVVKGLVVVAGVEAEAHAEAESDTGLGSVASNLRALLHVVSKPWPR
jgi:hypothetical protein